MIARRHRLALLLSVALLAIPFTAARAEITYAGRNGSNMAKAVIIKGATEEKKAHAERAWLAKHFPGYTDHPRMLRSHWAIITLDPVISSKIIILDSEGEPQETRSYDEILITTAAGAKKTVYFEVTDFPGK